MMGVDDVNAVPDPPSSRFHRHEWHAHAGDDRWRCACGAEARELRRTDGTVVALPKAVV